MSTPSKSSKQAPLIRAYILDGMNSDTIAGLVCLHLDITDKDKKVLVRRNVDWYRRDMMRRIAAGKRCKVDVTVLSS